MSPRALDVHEVRLFVVSLTSAYRSRETITAYGRDLHWLAEHLTERAPAAAADVRAIDLAALRSWLAPYT